LNDNSFPDTRAAKCANLAPSRERAHEIDYFDTRFENLRFYVLVDKRRCRAMDRIAFFKFHGTAIINRIASDIKEPPKHSLAHRYGDGPPSIRHTHSAL